jgi:hypothetical protein
MRVSPKLLFGLTRRHETGSRPGVRPVITARRVSGGLVGARKRRELLRNLGGSSTTPCVGRTGPPGSGHGKGRLSAYLPAQVAAAALPQASLENGLGLRPSSRAMRARKSFRGERWPLSSAVGMTSTSGGQANRTCAEDFAGAQTQTSGEAVR